MCFTYVRICITKGKIRINIYFETRPSQSQYDLEYHSVQSLSHATKNHFSQYTHTKHIHTNGNTFRCERIRWQRVAIERWGKK